MVVVSDLFGKLVVFALGAVLLGKEEEVEDPGHQDGLQHDVVGGCLSEREAGSSP